MGGKGPQLGDMRKAAKKAAEVAREIVGAPSDKTIYEMGSLDQGTIERLITALLEWDAARLGAEARRLEAEAKLKGKDR